MLLLCLFDRGKDVSSLNLEVVVVVYNSTVSPKL